MMQDDRAAFQDLAERVKRQLDEDIASTHLIMNAFGLSETDLSHLAYADLWRRVVGYVGSQGDSPVLRRVLQTVAGFTLPGEVATDA